MKNTIQTIAVIISSIAMLVSAGSLKSQSHRHDCSLAEISPDFSTAARQACRAKRNGGRHASR